MPSRQQLETALMNADKAGDTQAAQQIATAIKNNQFDQGFMSNVGSKLTERGEQFGKNMFSVSEDMLSFNPLTSIPANLKAIRRTGGLLAGGMGDIIGEGVVQGLDVITPEPIQERFKSLIGGVANSAPAQAIKETQASLKQADPSFTQDLADIANMAGMVPIGKGAQLATKAVGDIASVIPQRTAKQVIGEKLLKGSTDVDTAAFKLKPQSGLQKALDIGSKRIEADKVAKETIKQGFDPAVIAAVKGAVPADRVVMKKMVTNLEKGKNNALFAQTNRPSDIVGDSLMKRFSIINNTNKKAGKMLDRVANSLKGKPLDTQTSINGFIDDLSGLGVSFDKTLKPIFKGSDIEGVAGAEKAITNIVNRMKSNKIPDAHDAHRLKRFIDEQVTFGKTAEGLTGKSVGVIKKLRHNLDSQLDEAFPRYNKVNTAYSDTIKAIDALQDVAGKKMNLTGVNADKATGTLLRRVMSNTQSRVLLLDAMETIEGTATKYGGKFKDNLMNQILFVDELDKVFKPVARTSFQGQISQAVDRAVASAATGGASTVVKGLGKAADKLQGINEAAALKSIRELLNR